MENNVVGMEYSIIYAVLRQEISEQISVGIIIIGKKGISIRYSEKKLRVLKGLYGRNKYRFLSRTVRGLKNSGSIVSADSIDYLSRYSNNLLTISRLKRIDLEQTKSNEEWLYDNYVYGGKSSD